MNRFYNWKQPDIDKEGWTVYGWRCQHPENLILGRNVDIGCFTYLNAKHGITIEDDVQIGSHCSIYSDNTENNTQGMVMIGKKSLIGSFSLILPGSVIKPNSKIRAYSIIKGE
jgi:acetyltransferase-like isoleucine patch superfamily enzyme